MLLHLANIIEQLDLALEHLSKRDPNNARFGLMLTDNVVELSLHRLAKDEQAKLKEYAYLREGYQHMAALEKALGRHFEAKAKLAKALGFLSDEVYESLLTFHSLRNEVYHIGVQHESVLSTLAIFYFEVACDLLGKYEPPYLSWGSSQKLPERAKKHFRGDSMFPGSLEEYRSTCVTLGQAVGHDPSEVKVVLAAHLA